MCSEIVMHSKWHSMSTQAFVLPCSAPTPQSSLDSHLVGWGIGMRQEAGLGAALGVCVGQKRIQARVLPAHSETEPPILVVSVTAGLKGWPVLVLRIY